MNPDTVAFLEAFGINIISSLVLVVAIYHVKSKRRDFVFSFLMVSTAVFLLCRLLVNVELDLAFALGLFAIFGIIRYRTDAIPIREMTYLFIVIALSVLNSLADGSVSTELVLIANGVIIAMTLVLERFWVIRHIERKTVIYDRVDLLHAGRREELIADLEERTGVEIIRIQIGKVDLLRDTATISVHYDGDKHPNHYETNSSEQ